MLNTDGQCLILILLILQVVSCAVYLYEKNRKLFDLLKKLSVSHNNEEEVDSFVFVSKNESIKVEI